METKTVTLIPTSIKFKNLKMGVVYKISLIGWAYFLKVSETEAFRMGNLGVSDQVQPSPNTECYLLKLDPEDVEICWKQYGVYKAMEALKLQMESYSKNSQHIIKTVIVGEDSNTL